jgi:hypothetical protein
VGELPVFNRASQNIVAAAMLLCNMPEHLPPRPGGPTMRFEVSSKLWPCSRLRVPPRGATGLPRSILRSPLGKKGRPRSILSPHLKGTRLPLSENVSSTTASLETPETTSTSAVGARVVMKRLEASTSTEVGVMIAPRITVHHPSHQALKSLAIPFETPSFRSGFAPIDFCQVQRRDQTWTLAH